MMGNGLDRVQGTPEDWLLDEMTDAADEEVEVEIEDVALSRRISEIHEKAHSDSLPRHLHFREHLRLQAELIKLQDWVVHHRKRVVILFEGRDSAGKGGLIKRITQRLNPRVVRSVALPAPSDRETTQWCFQRYVPPARGQRDRAL